MTAAEPNAAHVHSLMHCNLNTTDVVVAAAFYADLLGLAPGMKTDRVATDGRSLDFPGTVTSEVWFMYDARGPRASPALELAEWVDPATEGQHPVEPHHLGLWSVGYGVPSFAGEPGEEIGALPVQGELRQVRRVFDLDGVPVELVESGGESPTFSHLRLNCADLEASTQWYRQLGFVTTGHFADDVAATRASLQPAADASFSLELTQWHDPAPVGQAASNANHRGLYRIALGVDDVVAAHAALSAVWDGVPEPIFVPLPGTRLGGVVVMFLHDPDGIVVELVGRPRTSLSARTPLA
jgi:catechol 2,3-dioxygenase-like lactoylglutathione lyase family enzyme